MNYKAILFDLDGTLLDYKAAQRNATENRVEFDLVNSPEVLGYEVIGIPEVESPKMQAAFKRAGVHQKPDVFLKNYFSKLSRQGMLIMGVIELLDYLFGKVKLAVISNGIGYVQKHRLKTAGIIHYFSHFYYSHDIGVAKPNPLVLQKAMKELGVKQFETLFIGDSITSDLPAAKTAGVDFFLFKGDFADPELISLLTGNKSTG